MASEKASFTVALDDKVSAPSKEAAAAVAKLRASIGASTEKLQEMQAAQRRLKGSSDELKNARADLKKRIDLERIALAQNSLELFKNGASLKKTKAETEKLAEAQEKSGKRSELFTGALRKIGEMAVESTVALAKFSVQSVIGLGKFVLGGADAARSAGLLREAWLGNAGDAERLGNQIDQLANKVPTAKGALNDMAIGLAKSNVTGKTLVDTLNAVAQASAALGDESGNKLKEFVTRGSFTKRFMVSPLELRGTGIAFKDLAESLAKNMHTGVNEAATALASGRVTLAAGAEALRDAVEKKTGKINLRQMLSFPNLIAKAQEKLDAFTRNIKLEPLLEAFGKLEHLLDSNTVEGKALGETVVRMGTDLVNLMTEAIPIAKQVFDGMIVGSLKAELAYLQLRVALKNVFGKDILADQETLDKAFEVGKLTIEAMAVAAVALGVALYVGLKPLMLLLDTLVKAKNIISLVAGGKGGKLFEKDGTNGLDKNFEKIKNGQNAAQGLADGMTLGQGKVEDAAKGLAEAAKTGITKPLDIHSPSRVTEKYGMYTAEGFERGVDKGAPKAAESLNAMVTQPVSRGGAGASGAGAAKTPVQVTFVLPAGMAGGGGGKGGDASSPEFLAMLTKALEDALIAAGIPAIVE